MTEDPFFPTPPPGPSYCALPRQRVKLLIAELRPYFTNAKIAMRVGVTERTIARWAAGTSSPTLESDWKRLTVMLNSVKELPKTPDTTPSEGEQEWPRRPGRRPIRPTR